MAKGDEVLDALDHPIFFLVVVSIGVVSMLAVFTWMAKAAGLNGLASLTQNP